MKNEWWRYILNAPWTIIGLLVAIVSIPRSMFLKKNAIVFKVESFWWNRFAPGMTKLHIRAVTHGNIISLGPLEEENDLAHELVHVRQYMRQPFIQAILYEREVSKHGHGLKNKYEKEAYEATGSIYRGPR